jgi:hypothetical protein
MKHNPQIRPTKMMGAAGMIGGIIGVIIGATVWTNTEPAP